MFDAADRRHLAKDHLAVTGARWELPGAEAVLELRTLHCNSDLDAHWHYHLHQGQGRIHTSQHARDTHPRAA